jgi:endonuclease/exonuclease/phosphatase family metal-dependent hydrolase
MLRFGRVRYLGLTILGMLLVIWAVHASQPGTRVEGCPQGCALASERRDGPLRVLSLNIYHDFPRFEHLARRLDLIADEVRRHDADVVCLQEVPWTLGLGSGVRYLAEQTGMNYVYLRANGNRWAILFEEGEAILSRFPLRDPAFLELRPQAGPLEHRVVLKATAVTPWGQVPFFVTHLTNHRPQVRAAQTQALFDFLGGFGSGPALVAGDFNAVEHTPQMRVLNKRWIDVFRTTSPGDPGFTCCVDGVAGWQSDPFTRRVDYLFLVPGRGARVVSSRRVLVRPFLLEDGWLWASDHVGLLAAIDFEQ